MVSNKQVIVQKTDNHEPLFVKFLEARQENNDNIVPASGHGSGT